MANSTRRNFFLRTGLAAGATLARSQLVSAQNRTDLEPRVLNGQLVPEPPADKSAVPGRPGRGSTLMASNAAAMVTGAEYEVTGGDSAKDV